MEAHKKTLIVKNKVNLYPLTGDTIIIWDWGVSAVRESRKLNTVVKNNKYIQSKNKAVLRHRNFHSLLGLGKFNGFEIVIKNKLGLK